MQRMTKNPLKTPSTFNEKHLNTVYKKHSAKTKNNFSIKTLQMVKYNNKREVHNLMASFFFKHI